MRKAYSIFKPDGSLYRRVLTLDVEQYLVDNNLQDYTYELFGKEPTPLTTEQILKRDIEFGNKLIQLFLLDNRNDPNVKTSDSTVLLQKFQVVMSLLSLGDIKKCKPLVEAIAVDTIFTQERKTKYLNMINNHINS